ncbi:hypothetical protein PG985_011434 [Apiospora marii]|uniref:uncharacterized protein n=1 Tax=Apiospora marii TaxID=335849 RepID=UPI003130E63B
MVFLIGGDIEVRNRDLYTIPQLDPRNNIDILHNLRHLALRLFDIAQWPDSGISSWYRRGLEGLLQSASQLETFYIVVDRVFSGADFDPDYDTTATATAANNAQRSQQLVRSPSELLDVLKALPRNRYGFSDYDAFAAKTKLDILTPKLCSPAPHYRSVVRDFEEYDALIKRVQNQVRPYVNPPARQGRKVDFGVVVDLDSNMNGGGIGLVPRMVKMTLGNDAAGVERLVQGYDRYFARPAAWDWWADVSGYEPPKEKKEEESESDYLPDSGSDDESDEDI